MKLVWGFWGMRQTQARRGTVGIENLNGMLRLRWSYAGKRHCLALGVPDTKVNRLVAEAKAKTIQGDLATSNFDPTLKKYKTAQQQQAADISVADLFQRFTDYKRKKLHGRPMDKFTSLKRPIAEFFGGKTAAAIDDELADRFRLHLARTQSPATQKARLIAMNSCWKWAIKQGLVLTNPWGEAVRAVKVPPTQKPKPFTQAEVQTIISGFRGDRYYTHYADFVEFLFSSGCRIGEVVALRWRHLSADCSKVWIGESASRGKVRDTTKTGQSRQFRLTQRLQTMLFNRRSEHCKNDDLVFPAPKGGMLDDHRFRARAWSKMLSRLGVEYRHPYSCRHTFICHALDLGVKPMAIAEMTGHDPQTLFKHYASSIQGGAELPDLFSA
jgi:integrase